MACLKHSALVPFGASLEARPPATGNSTEGRIFQMVYQINYDLRKPGRNYESLIAEIKALGPWAHVLESSWMVNTSQSAVQIRDRLKQHIDANDGLLVTRFGGESAWYGLKPEVADWLRAA